MTTEKLLWMLIPLTLTVIAIVLGFKSYSIGLRNDIRVKYRRFIGQTGVEEMMQEEYEHSIIRTVRVFVVVILMSSVLAYLVALCLKNNIPLI